MEAYAGVEALAGERRTALDLGEQPPAKASTPTDCRLKPLLHPHRLKPLLQRYLRSNKASFPKRNLVSLASQAISLLALDVVTSDLTTLACHSDVVPTI